MSLYRRVGNSWGAVHSIAVSILKSIEIHSIQEGIFSLIQGKQLQVSISSTKEVQQVI